MLPEMFFQWKKIPIKLLFATLRTTCELRLMDRVTVEQS